MSLTITRTDNGYLLESTLLLPRGREEVFPFFADARNLEQLTPSYLRFEVLTPEPLEMRRGLLIDYRLRVHHVPLQWQSEITAWEPPQRFVDEQRRGPYRHWTHEHTFEEREAGTLVADRVRYGVPGGRLAHGLFVGPDLRRIFTHRTEKLRELFGG